MLTFTSWRYGTCGKCDFFNRLSPSENVKHVGLSGPKLGNCFRAPPTPIMIGISNNSPQIMITFPRLPEDHPACGSFVKAATPTTEEGENTTDVKN